MLATIPQVFYHGTRRFVSRRAAEKYKAELAGIPFRDDPAMPDAHVPIKRFAEELGVTVRTIERRIVEQRAGADASAAGREHAAEPAPSN
jgi:hypothetical protein